MLILLCIHKIQGTCTKSFNLLFSNDSNLCEMALNIINISRIFCLMQFPIKYWIFLSSIVWIILLHLPEIHSTSFFLMIVSLSLYLRFIEKHQNFLILTHHLESVTQFISLLRPWQVWIGHGCDRLIFEATLFKFRGKLTLDRT